MNHIKVLPIIFTTIIAAGILLVAGASYGHEPNYIIKANESHNDLPAPAEHDDDHLHEGIEQSLSEIVAKQILPLREQLDRLEAKTRMQDVLGAVGYIIGIAGIAFYFLASRKLRQPGQSTEHNQQP